MPALRDDIDPDGLLEYSVVFSDRSLNSMSDAFGEVMRDISRIMRNAYGAASVAVVPGGGTYGMEAIACQFANDARVLVIRNGWFSYRWSQIMEAGRLASHTTVLAASRPTTAPTRHSRLARWRISWSASAPRSPMLFSAPMSRPRPG